MIPFVAAGAAAGGLSYFVGLPLAYAAFLAIAVVAVAAVVSSALIVKVPQVEHKVRKTKADKTKERSKADKARLNATAASAAASEDNTDSPSKDEESEDTKADTKVNNKREKERAKKAAKKEAEEKNKKVEAERVAAEKKAAEKKAAEEAEKERLAALEAEDEDEDEAPAKKKNKKKKKKAEEKKNVDASTSATKPSETKVSTTTKAESAKKVEEAPAAAAAPAAAPKKNDAKKTEAPKAVEQKKSDASSAPKKVEASAPNKKIEAPKPVEQPAAASESKLEEKETKSAAQESSAWEEVKGGKKSRRAAEPVAADTTSPSDEQKVDIFLDPKSFGVIIGKAGSTLKLITDATQTNIDLSKKEEGRVTVSGSSRENIDKAIDAMNQLASKGYSVLTHGRRDEGSIEVPPSKRFNVIGPGGQTVRLIQEKLKVKINLPERNTADSTVTVLGDSANVQEAIKCISELIEKGYSEVTHSGYVSETIEVPSGQMGSIIGAGGAMIKEIQDTTGAKLNTEGSTVVVVGQRAQVTEAVNKIAQLLTPPEPLPADPEWSREASSRYIDLW